MSKQSEAKKTQAYCAKPFWPVCSNCGHFTSDSRKVNGVFGGTYTIEKDKRCSLGEFACKKTGSCKAHFFKRSTEEAPKGTP